MLSLILQRKEFSNVLHQFEKLPVLNNLSQEVQQERANIIKIIKTGIRIFAVVFTLTALAYLLKPLFLTSKALPIETYHPINRNKSLEYQSMYAFQVFCMITGIISMVGFDSLLISFIIIIILEIKALKAKFSTLPVLVKTKDDQKCLKEVYQLIDHHSLVLACIKDLNKIYSSILMVQFSSTVVCVNIALLNIVATGFPPALQQLTKYTGFLLTVLSQLFMYCITGSYLTAESESLSDAVYESAWWIKTQPQLRRALSLVIQRSNKKEKLIAGGMLTLNLETFTAVVKMCLSLLTLVQAVYSRVK